MGWRSMGMKTLIDFYDNDVLKSLKQLRDTFNLPAVHSLSTSTSKRISLNGPSHLN